MRGIHRVAGLAILAGLGGLLLAVPVLGQVIVGNQMPNPRLTFITPMGAKQGTTVELSVAGSDLDEPSGLIFSHPDIKAEAVEPTAPPKPDPKAEPMKGKKGGPATQPAATRFKVTVGPKVPLGHHDVRLVGKWGVSNPRAFVVGDLEEANEKEPNNDVDQAQRVALNTTANGQIANPTDVDYYVFTGKKGQRVVVACLGPGVDSKINPELKVVMLNGREVAYNRPPPGGDAVADAILPEDGDYYVRLCQFTYTQGGADFFYRLSISTAPWIEAAHPSMVEPGKTSKVTLYGRNLPGGQIDPTAVLNGRALEKLVVDVTPPKDADATANLEFSGLISPTTGLIDGFEYRLKAPTGLSNPVLFTYASAPVVLDNEKNDTPETAQAVPLPCEIAGRIEKRKDRDWYKFSAKKDSVYVIDLLSHRLGAPTDLLMTVRNNTGKAATDMVQLDDSPETVSPTRFYTPSRDPAPYRFVAPADGEYQILVASHVADTVADPHQFYRLRISEEKPDFRLIVMPPDTYRPDTCVVGQGGNNLLAVYPLRRDGFKQDIQVEVEGLPPGVVCKPQICGANQKQLNLVLSATADAPAWAGTIKVKGSANVGNQTVTRYARPATVTWASQPQANLPTISRMDRSLVLAVRDKAPYNLSVAVDKVTVVLGDKATIPLKVTRHWPDFKQPLQITPVQPPLVNDLPTGITAANVTIAPDKNEGTLVLNVPANVTPGTYTIAFQSFAQIPFTRPGGSGPNPQPKGKGGNVNVVQPSTPVVLIVLPKQVATLSLGDASPKLKPGEQVELLVKVARQADYAGEFKVSLELPPKSEGLSFEPLVIAAGKNEGKLILRADAKAAPGTCALVVRAVAVVGGANLTHELKLNVNVAK